MKLTITGPPRTKKNHGTIVRAGGRPRLIPSRAWTKWWKAARIIDAETQRDTYWGWGKNSAIDYPVNCAAVFYRDRNQGDAVGYYQGLADLLEKRGVVVNDKYIVSWDGSRLDIDRKNPRVEVELTATE